MNTAGETGPEQALRCLVEAVAGLTGGAAERRHELLMEWAEHELALEREYAEQVYALAEEEDLEPVYGFLLVRCGVGVIALEPPEQDADEAASQQAPPEWLGEETVELEDVELERRLRASFRRFRGHLEGTDAPEVAARSFVEEPDVGVARMTRTAPEAGA
jgi:hypothetical protein